ncbi:hypothetical protein [Roseomonas populi]|uniref:Uncharacterized protein n=1 Tax=Roseomonas populi TaxID=3121582 RepID=A0ABT1XCQ8_9PROT|nr:hypothetical protein [Roseomonas pecuniae]MCR0985494.1 hypothetical protein [Roseomonas pecuniae]
MVLALVSAALFVPVATTYFETGLMLPLTTFVASAMLTMLSFLALACGLILDAATRGRIEA